MCSFCFVRILIVSSFNYQQMPKLVMSYFCTYLDKHLGLCLGLFLCHIYLIVLHMLSHLRSPGIRSCLTEGQIFFHCVIKLYHSAEKFPSMSTKMFCLSFSLFCSIYSKFFPFIVIEEIFSFLKMRFVFGSKYEYLFYKPISLFLYCDQQL